MTKTPAIAPAIPRIIVGILRIRLPIAMIGIPIKIQPTAKNGTLQNKNSKEIPKSRECKPVETPHMNQVAANASSEISMRVVSVAFAIKVSQERSATEFSL